MKSLRPRKIIISLIVAAIVIGALGYGIYHFWELYDWKQFLEAGNANLTKVLESTESNLRNVQAELDRSQKDNTDLTETLASEQGKNKIFESQINDLAGTVGTLQKLKSLDPELLKKYSKVYFLSENYTPAKLSNINTQYLYDQNKPQLIHSGVLPFIEGMLAAATQDGVTIQVLSAYRSFYEQADLKVGYKTTYGYGANQFSADQGYSEHQLGTAADLATPEVKGLFIKFDTSKAYAWLTNNAYRYGFILSYPKNNVYYQYEPWHWRFVGTALATKLHNEQKYFYELTQRELDSYLISIFD